jgi:putative toxin-antitoxin system antitoxin component (TIGR02293 family)
MPEHLRHMAVNLSMETLLLPDLHNVPFEHLDGRRLLGIERARVEAVREGLPAAAFDTLEGLLGVAAHELAGALRLAPRTLTRRREAGAFTPEESDRLLRLARLCEMALYTFDDAEAAARWMSTPSTVLEGESPLHHADTEPGARDVETMLASVVYGHPF